MGPVDASRSSEQVKLDDEAASHKDFANFPWASFRAFCAKRDSGTLPAEAPLSRGQTSGPVARALAIGLPLESPVLAITSSGPETPKKNISRSAGRASSAEPRSALRASPANTSVAAAKLRVGFVTATEVEQPSGCLSGLRLKAMQLRNHATGLTGKVGMPMNSSAAAAGGVDSLETAANKAWLEEVEREANSYPPNDFGPAWFAKDEPRSKGPERPKVAPVSEPVNPEFGKVLGVLDAIRSQEAAVDIILRAAPGERITFLGFSFDRSELVHALVSARKKGCLVRVVLDRQMTLHGKTREQLSSAKELVACGVLVRLAAGLNLQAEYAAVGRSIPGHLCGIQHAKSVLAGNRAVVGSCNWTTSSRSNGELGLLVEFQESHLAAIEEMFLTSWHSGQELSLASIAEAQRAASEPRARSARR